MAISLAESLRVGIADILMRKMRSAVTVIGIVLGVMSIMVVMAIMNGMNSSTLDWMSQRGGLNKIEITPNWAYDASKGGKSSFSVKEIAYLRAQLAEAEAFNPSVQYQHNELQYGELGYMCSVGGVYPDMVKVEDWKLRSGRFIADLDITNYNNVIVLGSTVASELFGNRDPLGQFVAFSGQKLMVIGVLERKYMKSQGGGGMFGDNAFEYLNKRGFIPLTTHIGKVDPGREINSLELQAASPEAAKALRQKAENLVLNLRQGKPVFRVESAQEQMESMKKNSLIFTVIFFLIAVISLLVGGIVIMNIMLASIKERTREIGVRIAIGARGKDIFRQFLVQTVLITGLGGVIGVLLGYAILGGVGKYLNLELLASVQMVWTALGVSVGVGLLFGILPAIRAGQLNPIEALREE